MEANRNMIDIFKSGCVLVLFEFRADISSVKDKILCNFLAKSISQLDTIQMLSYNRKTSDGYMLYRGMIDRLGHLFYLQRTETFQQFDDWSFIQKYEFNNSVLSDPNFNTIIEASKFKPTITDTKKYQTLKLIKNIWSRPKNIEDEFKKRELGFLYKYGYDHASGFVHPLSNDGEIEGIKLLEVANEIAIQHDDYWLNILLQNSCLISSMTIQECLNQSSFKWHTLVYDFINSFRQAMNNEENKFQLYFQDLKTIRETGFKLKQTTI